MPAKPYPQPGRYSITSYSEYYRGEEAREAEAKLTALGVASRLVRETTRRWKLYSSGFITPSLRKAHKATKGYRSYPYKIHGPVRRGRVVSNFLVEYCAPSFGDWPLYEIYETSSQKDLNLSMAREAAKVLGDMLSNSPLIWKIRILFLSKNTFWVQAVKSE